MHDWVTESHRIARQEAAEWDLFVTETGFELRVLQLPDFEAAARQLLPRGGPPTKARRERGKKKVN